MSKARKTAEVEVRLLCIYSGGAETFGPGDVIAVDAAEAERLIGLKAAVAHEASVAAAPEADAPEADG